VQDTVQGDYVDWNQLVGEAAVEKEYGSSMMSSGIIDADGH